MIKKIKYLTFLLIFTLLFASCSFDNKTGIWSGSEEEKRRISELEKEQKQIIDVSKIYSTTNVYSDEIPLNQKISLSQRNIFHQI